MLLLAHCTAALDIAAGRVERPGNDDFEKSPFPPPMEKPEYLTALLKTVGLPLSLSTLPENSPV